MLPKVRKMSYSLCPAKTGNAIAALLAGQRIGKRIGLVNIETIADLIVRLATLATDLGPLLAELDINPVALVGDGTQAFALDALARIAGDEHAI